jgi:single-strand DNA-binding protein
MNSCILMAEIIQDPQLRYTPDQVAISEMLVQFPGVRSEDPPSTLKVVGWGNLAQTIQETYHQGDRILIEGRLNMNTLERPEGFKEKRAELTAQRIHRLGADTPFETYSTASAGGLSTPESTAAAPVSSAPVTAVSASSSPQSSSPSIPQPEPDYDDIPF